MEISVDGKKIATIFATIFSPLFLLRCYRQVASIFTFVPDYFVKLLLLKCLRSIETRKLHVRVVLPKLQNLILRVTRRDVQLEHYIVPNVPISPRNPKIIWITILPRSIVPQNLMLPSIVNFVIKSFQGFALDVNIETLNTECRLDQKQEMWMWNILWEMLKIIDWAKSCVPVNISWWIRNLSETQSIQLRSGNSQGNNREWETWSFFQQFEMCSKSESGFWLHFEKYRRRRVQIILRTRKQYPAGSIQTCVHPWRLGKVERLSQPKWRHRVL